MVERLEYLGGIGNAPMVEIHHTNETFKPLDLDRPGEVGDGSDLGQEGLMPRWLTEWPRKSIADAPN